MGNCTTTVMNCRPLIGVTKCIFPLLYLQVNPSDTDSLGRMVELWFIFSLIWSICASVDEDGRKRMDNFLREMEGTFPAKVFQRTFLFTH